MPKIIGLVPSPDQPGSTTILVDGAVFATVPARTPSARNDDEAPNTEPPLDAATKTTYERALKLLSFRARSAKELTKRLLEKGEPEEHVEIVVARLRANGLLNDARFAEGRARAGLLDKSRSRRRLEQDLMNRGVARDVACSAIQRVLEAEGTNEVAVAERAALKKLRSLTDLEPRVQREKLYGFLARQGYGADVVRQVIRSVLAMTPPDESDE